MYLQLFLFKFVTSKDPKKDSEGTSLKDEKELLPWFLQDGVCPKGYKIDDFLDKQYEKGNHCGAENCDLDSVIENPFYDPEYKEDDDEEGLEEDSDDAEDGAQVNLEESNDVDDAVDDEDTEEAIAIESDEESEDKPKKAEKRRRIDESDSDNESSDNDKKFKGKGKGKGKGLSNRTTNEPATKKQRKSSGNDLIRELIWTVQWLKH